MKIKIEGEKIIKAVKKLNGIEIVLENDSDAKEALNLVLRKTESFREDDFNKLKDFKVSSFQQYDTSAVKYSMVFLLEFLFEDNFPLDSKVQVIKEIQDFFTKV
jgi:hypothetical protein